MTRHDRIGQVHKRQPPKDVPCAACKGVADEDRGLCRDLFDQLVHRPWHPHGEPAVPGREHAPGRNWPVRDHGHDGRARAVSANISLSLVT